MRRLAALVAAAVAMAACGGADDGPAVLLSISAGSEIADADVARIVELDVDVRGAETFTHVFALNRPFSASRLERVRYEGRARDGQLSLMVTALDRDRHFIGYGSTLVMLAGERTVPGSITLRAQRPPDVDPVASTLVVDKPTGLYANGNDKATVTVTIIGSDGRPQPGLDVQLAVTGGGNTITQPMHPTDEHGIAVGALSSVVAEDKTITAVVSSGATQLPLPAHAAVRFNPWLIVSGACASQVGQTCIAVEVLSSPGMPTEVDQLELSPIAGFALRPINELLLPATPGGPLSLPVTVAIHPDDAFGGTFTVAVRGRRNGHTVGSGSVTGGVDRHGHTTVQVRLAPTPVDSDMGSAGGSTVDATRSSVTVDRASGVLANGADAAVVTIALVDTTGAPLSGHAVALSVDGSAATVTQPGLTPPSGIVTALLTATAAGSVTVHAIVDPGPEQVALADDPTVAFLAAGTATLAFAQDPPSATVDDVIGPAVRVVIEDALGNVLPASTPITLALASTAGDGALSGDVVQAANAGTATFANLNVDAPGSGYTLVATAAGLPATTSASFAVAPKPWVAANLHLDGGNVQQIVFDPTTPDDVYAVTTTGPFRARDGKSWRSVGYGLAGTVTTLAVDSRRSGVAYAAAGAQVFKTTNHGASWTATGALPADSAVNQIVVDPSSPDIVYGAFNGLVRSSDAGQTWTVALSAIVDTVVVAGTSPATVYAFGNGSVFRSTNHGVDFTQIADLPDLGPIVGDPTDSNVLYLAGQGALYKTTDAGDHWAALTGGLPDGTQYRTLTLSPSQPKRVYAVENIFPPTLWMSDDGGDHWKPRGPLPQYPQIAQLAVDPRDAATLLLAGTGTILRSSDGGSTWSTNVDGLHAAEVVAMTQANGIVFVATRDSGLFSSNNGGASWQPINQGLIGGVHVSALVSDGSGIVYASTDDYPLWRWDPEGAAWAQVTITSSPRPTSFSALVVNPVKPKNLIGAERWVIQGPRGNPVKQTRFWVSTDGGTEWTNASTVSDEARALSFPKSAQILAVFANQVLVSSDGSGWSDFSTGIVGTNNQLRALGGTNPLWLVGSATVYQLNTTPPWAALSNQPPFDVYSSLAIDGPKVMLGSLSGAYLTSDQGATWTTASSGLRGLPVATMLTGAGAVFAGTPAGVYRTTSHGQ